MWTSYEVLSALGAGGMGEVYRARDTKLNRDVALKVLPDLVARDPDRLARFEREAQILAALNHPNIAHIHGLEESGSGPAAIRAIVMELVEGPTLADRIARGAIPLSESLPIAKQIAEALEAAVPDARGARGRGAFTDNRPLQLGRPQQIAVISLTDVSYVIIVFYF